MMKAVRSRLPVFTLISLTAFFALCPKVHLLSSNGNPGFPQCLGAFDLYFVLDSSRTVGQFNFQNQTVKFVKQVTDNFVSPKTRISFITFSMDAKIVLTLTSKVEEVSEGFMMLRKVNADGDGTYVHHGFEKVNEQVELFGSRTASIVIVLTDGDFHAKNTAINRAKKVKESGATVFVVGVSEYKMTDLSSVASEPASDHVFQSNSYNALDNLISGIMSKACIEINEASPSKVCPGENYSLKLFGRGFTKTRNLSTVYCSFLQRDLPPFVVSPSYVSDSILHCPAPTLDVTGSSVLLQVSVNGKTFVSSNVTVSAKDCRTYKVSWIPALVGILVSLFVFLVLLCWWFWKLLPCSKKEPIPPTVSEPPKKKWKTVDASFYGGGGVGGVKPVRVQWGNRGATESGKMLTNAPDAKILESTDEDDVTGMKSFRITLRARLAAISVWIRSKYHFLSKRRPRKGGRSKLFTSRSEGYRIARTQLSTSSETQDM